MKFNKILSNLKNYETGKPIELVVREFGTNPEDVVKLASNENPFDASKMVEQGMQEVFKNAYLYPDDSYYELKDALANKHNVQSSNIIIGAGSDQIIEFCVHAKANKKSAVLMAGATFSMYEIYAKQVGAEIIRTKSKTHNLKELTELYKANKDKISIIFLCLPNNPLGECADAKDVYKFINKIKKNVLVVVDCAYMEFASFKDQDKLIQAKYLIENFENAIFLGTFSKAYGLGGMCISYGIANKFIISELNKLRPPFDITTLSLRAAILALQDQNFVDEYVKNIFLQMKRYEAVADSLNIEYIPSYANFITLKFKEQNSTDICQNLLKKGIILRDLQSYGLNAIRITIGTSEQNTKVLEHLREILK
ncbi:histidinol-phosphate transaminase [Campylobacter pinnipediorum subsp. pinnipediorum]|uniref:Histidinol-phosphate aminotransferase n=1 Tax=Campylobacter pinnipediorum subsp. pinnipediorum TaxID=1660067 RepID=A0AAX0LB00_9BACT|nr:histidinol-phosphate transaminase [Campylobacter pinnipediorum]OPA76443.1 histidinol-phosphate transaminase [Campylobacter pinnipediorum subsp. pinnipediorum]